MPHVSNRAAAASSHILIDAVCASSLNNQVSLARNMMRMFGTSAIKAARRRRRHRRVQTLHSSFLLLLVATAAAQQRPLATRLGIVTCALPPLNPHKRALLLAGLAAAAIFLWPRIPLPSKLSSPPVPHSRLAPRARSSSRYGALSRTSRAL